MAGDFVTEVHSRTGLTVETEWAEARVDGLLVQVRRLALAKRTTWLTFDVLPADVQLVVLDALARAAENPRGYRSEQIGEYSYQAGSIALGVSGVFTVPEEAVIAIEAGNGSGALYSVGLTGSRELPAATPDIDWDLV
jgi:hypothetical protein